MEIKGRYCKVDYSQFGSEIAYASHIAGLADKVIPEIKSIHAGRNPDKEITIILELKEGGAAAATAEKTIWLNMEHFDKVARTHGTREADDGAIVHEIDHALLWAPRFDSVTHWLIEGLADYVRDKLGFQRETRGDSPGSYAHFEKEKALAGYQTSAHFLMYLEELRPGVVNDLANALAEDTYNEGIFEKLFGKTLGKLVEEYEKKNEPIPREKEPIREERGILRLISRLFSFLSRIRR